MAIFLNFSPTSNLVHPLQVENCDSNSRLVVDGNDNGKFRLERVNPSRCIKASFYISENRLYFPKIRGYRMTISLKPVYNSLQFS